MAYVVSKALSGRTVKVYRESEYPVPVIFSTQYQEQGKRCSSCSRISARRK